MQYFIEYWLFIVHLWPNTQLTVQYANIYYIISVPNRFFYFVHCATEKPTELFGNKKSFRLHCGCIFFISKVHTLSQYTLLSYCHASLLQISRIYLIWVFNDSVQTKRERAIYFIFSGCYIGRVCEYI